MDKKDIDKLSIAEPLYYKRTIKEWPEGDRPREKLNTLGPNDLSETELIAILLRSGKPGKTAIDFARELIKERNLREISAMSVSALKPIVGGMVRATTLVAAFELARRVQMIDISSKKYFYSPDIVSEHYISKLRDSKQEEFWCLMLSSSKQMIRETQITIGTLNSSQVTPRESFKTAIQESAASVIFIHNHPSGNPEPSNEDIALTKQFVLAGNIIGIPVDDHIIIGGSQSVSLLERGVI